VNRRKRSNGLRTCSLLLAALLLGAFALDAGFAAEGGSAGSHAARKLGKPIAPRNLLGRRTLSRGASERVAPNAIGVLVPQPGGVRQLSTGPSGVGPAGQPAADGGRGAIGLGNAGRTTNLQRLQLPSIPTAKPTVTNRPGINGTTLNRLGSGPSGIGGPAKAVAGVSGTTVRPRH
jgi:hypothetical protein